MTARPSPLARLRAAVTGHGRTPLPVPADRPIRVLHVVQRYFPELGGLETHVAEVTKRLALRSDVEVTILTTDRSGALPERDEVGGVPVIRRRSWPKEQDFYFSPGIGKVIAQPQWDVIHFQGINTLVPLVGMLAAIRAGKRFVLTFHSGGHSSAGRTAARGAQFSVLAPLLRRSAKLIAVSRFEKKRFSAATGIDPDHFVVIGNGGALPAVAADVTARQGRMVSSGRLEKYKGHHRAIEAMPLILAEMPDADLVVLGAGPYEQALRDLAVELGVQDSVAIRHLPPADRSAMARELAQSSLMMALSSYEAHPVGVMEAVASGLPVLGFDIAGTGDLVEDGLVTGISAESSNEEIAAAALQLLRAQDPTAPRTRPEVDLPTWERCADGVAGVYQEVVGRAVAPADRVAGG
ncbi:glycosyltransferase family 4 protein [Nakamurella flavida]|uniref:Glycosyltransferase family 4 protein n=1 Tax=Nakamurella flavida TaxID=363630 RepID=A0A939BYW4_9ACTN|nr:glycosyltransferase family 4 protein [Nakamurella flavida]MBM9475108.1 glycosyltransferase family 4 protein [Nakamurella flavida]MDP9776678.1 glycosyltransferase involved in cell wall biosynthesis [Nakamurella flavida]